MPNWKYLFYYFFLDSDITVQCANLIYALSQSGQYYCYRCNFIFCIYRAPSYKPLDMTRSSWPSLKSTLPLPPLPTFRYPMPPSVNASSSITLVFLYVIVVLLYYVVVLQIWDGAAAAVGHNVSIVFRYVLIVAWRGMSLTSCALCICAFVHSA